MLGPRRGVITMPAPWFTSLPALPFIRFKYFVLGFWSSAKIAASLVLWALSDPGLSIARTSVVGSNSAVPPAFGAVKNWHSLICMLFAAAPFFTVGKYSL